MTESAPPASSEQAALAWKAVAPASAQHVRAAAPSDLPLLDEIAEDADAVFRLARYELPQIPLDEADLARAKAVFVAGRPPVGFIQLNEVDGLAHIAELAVMLRCMRQGIGSRLLERGCAWAAAQGYPSVTLITYADVPWNGPYYATRGFREVPRPTPGLLARRERERQVGLDGVGRRTVMRREV